MAQHLPRDPLGNYQFWRKDHTPWPCPPSGGLARTKSIPTVNVGNAICKRHTADVEGKISGCSVVGAVEASSGKNKLIPILYADMGDPAATTNVDKAASIGKKSPKKEHPYHIGHTGGDCH